MSNNDAQKESMNNEIRQLEYKNFKLQFEMESKNNQTKQLEENLNVLREEIERKNYDNRVLNDNNIKLQMEIECRKVKTTEVEENLSSLENDIANKDKHIDELKRHEMEAKSKVSQLEESEKRLQEVIKSQNELIGKLQEEIKSMNHQQINACNMCVEQNKQILELITQVNLEPQKLPKYENQIKSRNEKLSKKDMQIHNSSDLHTRLEEIKAENAKTQSRFGNSKVRNLNLETLNVPCNSDIACSGWTLIQQNINGSVSFNKDWKSYQTGFGWLDDNFFLGLEEIYRLTNEQPHELYIHMKTSRGETYFARYNDFAISNQNDLYKIMKLGRFSGNTKDFLSAYKNNRFSTFDRDNDQSSENCASIKHSGWWYNDCGFR